MQAVTMENDIRDSGDYGYYRQNLYRPENSGAATAANEELTLEEAVYNGAGEDVVSDISSINNPLSNPEERTAFQERIAAQVNMETQAAGAPDTVSDVYVPAVSEAAGASDYQPELPGSSEGEIDIELLGSGSGEEVYMPELPGSGEKEVEVNLLGSGSGEEGYQPELLGSGEKEVEVNLLGSDSEKEGYQPELLGSGNDKENEKDYQPKILGSKEGKENTETVHIKSRQSSHEGVKRNTVKASKSGSAKVVKLGHSSANKIVKSHKKLTSNSAANRSSVERLAAQIESSIKESMKNNRENSREMSNMIHKKSSNIIEKIAHNAKSSSKDSFKNGSGDINEEYAPKHKDNDLSCQCPTCKNRRFVDRSNDVGVSFSAPQRMNSAGAAIIARSHEAEHVAAENRKAFQEGRTIVRQSVTIYMRNCPDCGARYVAGGVTRTITKMRADVAYKKAMETVRNRHKNRDL